MSYKHLLSGLILSSALLSGCYHVPVPQGNILSEQKVSKIKPGMTASKVIALLGTPVINNTFANNQGAYVYTMKKIREPLLLKRVIIYLQNDRVINVTYDQNVNGRPLPPQKS